MHLDELVQRINEIQRALDAAEAQRGSSQGEALLREAAIFACRTYAQVVQDEDLAIDLQRMRGEATSDDPRSTEVARRILEERYRDLVSAEASLLARLGIDAGLVKEAERRLLDSQADSQSELENGFEGVEDRFGELRRAICAQAEDLGTQAAERVDEVKWDAIQSRKKRKLRGGLLGLCGVVVIGGNGALTLVTGGLALASTSAGGALISLGGKEVFFGG